ncbi:hypothetical protein BBO99_00005072 [Phytophthora kernoviae]|uniref:CSC1/OSCA1-like 7TM region domain-containing protein n=2 Tax=Phytophthora kernoviae TaxID=325452 RepID=A0A421GPQ4_9STRA|nr:hypothetical protein G195_005862 [Phytophthora kernoviae 00238/432]KAG2523974.1 hypothetical protein JM16_005155 [Phytophthora kernoviae]KAG2525892.1 hypothetical protein JM18_004677 [Phytophthora kernoviae]RLN26744.1 hypothetical protein BBI17_004277 [Phytophthora kernoviae]RLN79719.1 hypothetical protein BBO99_00005072 [Phytophthora kernoviae]
MDSKEAPLLGRRRPAEREQRLRNNLGGDSEDDLMDEKKARRHEREMNQEEREQVRKVHPIRIMRRSAFISFTSLMSAQVAQQTLQSKDPVCMAVMPAPHASDINWDNIGLRYRTRTLGTLVSLLISGTIVLFWTIPTAFVASLATVESLRRALPFLNKAFDEYPLLEAVFKQIAPLALVGLSALAPIVFRFLSNREGHPSNTEARAALFTKLAYFQLVQTFFVTVVVGTILDSLKEILDKPKKASAPVITVVVLVVIVLLFNYFVITLYPPVAKYLPLMQCVRLDSERGLHDAKAPQFFFLDNVYRQPAMNEKAPIRADYRMLVSNYDEDTSLSPEIYSAEDQRLFTSVV